MPTVFLGGTCGENAWRRERAIPYLLARGVPPDAIVDPVVEDWDEAAQTAEARQKREATILLYYLTDPMTGAGMISAYSLIEATMGLYDDPTRTAVIFGAGDCSGHLARALDQCLHDLRARFPGGAIFANLEDGLRYVVARLVPVEER